MSLKDLDCQNVRKLEDIQDEDRYIDPSGRNNPYDKELVSCLQTHYKNRFGNEEEYNELKYIIDEYFADNKNNPSLYKALCECCKEKIDYKNSNNNFRKLLSTERDRFMDCMNNKMKNLLFERLAKN